MSDLGKTLRVLETMDLDTNHEIVRLIENDWDGRRILVVGDVMLDKYIQGNVDRISPEAPVPVVHALRRNQQPGAPRTWR